MQITKKYLIAIAYISLTVVPVSAQSGYKVIKNENLSFEKCLDVITASEKKLLETPNISNVSEQKRIAIFKLVDGAIKIVCDGVEGKVIVSTIID